MRKQNLPVLKYVWDELGIHFSTPQKKRIGGTYTFKSILMQKASRGSIEVFKLLLDRVPILDPNDPQ